MCGIFNLDIKPTVAYRKGAELLALGAAGALMLRHVVEKELKDCLYGYRSLLVFILASVLFLVGIYTGARDYQTELQAYRLAQAAQRQNLAEETNLYAISNFGFNLVKPPAALGILVSGVEPHTPHVYNMALYTLPEPQGSAASENPIVAVFGALDVSFIVQVVLGLAALLFTFSAICGEKELGTLKLQLANALPKDVLLLGKLAGNLIGLLVPVAVAFLLACILLMSLGAVSLNGEEVCRVLLLGISFALYLVVLFALGMCISTLTTRSTTAFALCLVVWVVVAAIIPRFAIITARRLAPAEPLQEFEMKKLAVHRRGTVEAQAEYSQYVQTHNGQTPPLAVYEELSRRIRDDQNRALRKLEEQYLQRKEQQARAALLLSRLSPAGSAAYAAMSLARTGLERDFRFRLALRDYRTILTAYYDRKSRELVNLTEGRRIPAVMATQNFTDLPAFEFQEESLASSLNRALPDLGFLLVWSLALFAVAYVKFLRYDVR